VFTKKIVLSLIIFLLPIVSFASTNTYPRTEDDLRINSWITVTEENKDNILNTPSVNEEEKIYDFADLYTDEEEKNLYSAVYDYTQRRNLDLVIVTINDNFESTQEYADDFYDYNNFGYGTDRDGLLFLVDMENRYVYISATGGAMSLYPDVECNMITEQVYTYFSDQNYYDGTYQMIKTLDTYYEISYNDSNIDEYKYNTADVNYLYVFIFATVCTIIGIVILIKRNDLVKVATTSEEYYDKGSIGVHRIKDVVIGHHVTKHAIQRDTGSHGGGFSGGGGHISSSGSSHTGGGHKF
jgi:uncharacterized protein